MTIGYRGFDTGQNSCGYWAQLVRGTNGGYLLADYTLSSYGMRSGTSNSGYRATRKGIENAIDRHLDGGLKKLIGGKLV